MKHKNKNHLYIITIVISIFIFTIAIGYAFFSESLTINGVASTMEYYDGTKLPTAPVILDLANNRYHTAEKLQYKNEYFSESWDGDTIMITYKKYLGMVSGINNTSTFKIAFTNPTVLPFTDGEVTSEITENTGEMLKDVSAAISKTALNPGEQCEVTFNLHTKITWRPNTETAKATISYMLQGKRKYLYFIVTYIAD